MQDQNNSVKTSPKKIFTKYSEISNHNTEDSMWLLIDNRIYDVTKFKHPGGRKII